MPEVKAGAVGFAASLIAAWYGCSTAVCLGVLTVVTLLAYRRTKPRWGRW
jgi:hypothetical protein